MQQQGEYRRNPLAGDQGATKNSGGGEAATNCVQNNRTLPADCQACPIPELAEYPQWTAWNWGKPDPKTGKRGKLPINPHTGKAASSTDPATWGTFEQARQAVEQFNLAGVGFCLTGEDPFVGVDVDDCLQGDPGPAVEIVEQFDSYTEKSPSGKGLRIICKGQLPEWSRKKAGDFEAYDCKRFVTITGNVWGEWREVREAQEAVNWYCREYLGERTPDQGHTVETRTTPEGELERRKAAARRDPKLLELFKGEIEIGGEQYPSPSEADSALIHKVAFYLGSDADAIEELAKQSALYRDKWDRRDGTHGSYIRRTINNALSSMQEFYRLPQQDQAENEPETLAGSLTFDFLHWCAVNEQEGDARLLVELLRNKYIFDHAMGVWNLWNEVHWDVDRESEVYTEFERLADIYDKQAKQASIRKRQATRSGNKDAENREKHLEQDFLSKIKKLQRIQHRKGVLELARSGPKRLSTAGESWDQHPHLLAVKNGVVDLRTGENREGDPEDMLRTAAPVEYPGADATCPAFRRFLADVFNGDPELIDFVQRLFGYALYGKTTEHILPILHGPGRNGKGVLLDVLSYILGPLAGSVEAELLLDQASPRSSSAPSPDIMTLRGKRLVWSEETDEKRKLAMGRVKKLVGGGTLAARPPYGRDIINFEPTHTLFLLTNHKPRVDPDDFALWQRLLLIPFENAFVDEPKADNERQRDPYMAEKLKEEAPAILSWLVRGCIQWQEQGLAPPDKVKAATQEYREGEDVIGHFIEDRCVRELSAYVKAQTLYEAYRSWCEQNGHRPLSGTKFAEKMRERFDSSKTRSGKVYYGIGLLQE